MDTARRRLLSQRLIGSQLKRPDAAVAWLAAVQAQDYSGAKWALGMRVRGATDEDVERAFNKGDILRTHCLRPTWHFVMAADIRWLLTLTAPRVHSANAHMYRKLELDASVFRRSTAALTKALQGGQQLTRDELRVVLEKARVRTDGELRMGYVMMRAELDAVVCSGARRGKQFTYALLDERVQSPLTMPHDAALAELARRYFKSRGPATVQDFAKWSGLTVADARDGLEEVSARLEREVVDGKTYWFAPSKVTVDNALPPNAHLLSIYDEYVSGYKDRSAIISARDGARLIALGNALNGIVLVNGRIVGTWKRRFAGSTVFVKPELFARVTRDETSAVNRAIETYGEFLGMAAKRES